MQEELDRVNDLIISTLQKDISDLQDKLYHATRAKDEVEYLLNNQIDILMIELERKNALIKEGIVAMERLVSGDL